MDCHLQRFVGVREECPGGACPFWESSRAEGHCGIERLALGPDDPQLAGYLLGVRDRLVRAHEVADDESHAAFARRLGRDV